MQYSEFRKFRDELVAAERNHPEWRKTKACPWDMAANVIPDSREAHIYWHLRNATRGLVRKYGNIAEDAAARLGGAFSPSNDFGIDERDARNVEKWLREWKSINA